MTEYILCIVQKKYIRVETESLAVLKEFAAGVDGWEASDLWKLEGQFDWDINVQHTGQFSVTGSDNPPVPVELTDEPLYRLANGRIVPDETPTENSPLSRHEI